jgi:hypothetical protein
MFFSHKLNPTIKIQVNLLIIQKRDGRGDPPVQGRRHPGVHGHRGTTS